MKLTLSIMRDKDIGAEKRIYIFIIDLRSIFGLVGGWLELTSNWWEEGSGGGGLHPPPTVQRHAD